MKNAQKRIFERNLTDKMTTNILQVWDIAKSRQLHLTDWYREANHTLLEIAGEYEISLENAAWVCATLSPNLRWDKNVHCVISFLDSWFGKEKQYTQIAYGPQVYKAELYMSGDLSGKPTGRKVSAFYENLLLDYSFLTIDRHAGRIALDGSKDIEKPTGDVVLGDIEFRCCVKAYHYVASLLGISVAQLQAVTWQVVNQEGK